MIFNDKNNRKANDDAVDGIRFIDEEVINKGKLFIGEIIDRITFVKDGEYEISPNRIITAKAGEILEVPTAYNTVVDNASKVIASLMKGNGFSGIQYWEVGEGSSTWDDANPPAPSTSDTKLVTPLYRKAVAGTDISFIDANSNVVTSPTNRIQVVVTFESSEANGYLREFGLFGGNAGTTLSSGYMINRKTHGVIYKTSGMELMRTLRLTF